MAVQQDPNALKTGSTIAGYEILRVIGSGGFGITYEAASRVTGKHVAIKEFFPRGIASREESTRIVFASRDQDMVEWALRRFETSTTEQCRLKHPNIVDVIHYVKDNDTGYMIMEYVEGKTLEHWLREREDKPSVEEVRAIMMPIFDALEYLHAQSFIHRDIAPDNIIIRPDGTPKIIDFGAIKLIEHETQIRSSTNRSFAISKQFYSPPEQVRDNSGKLDARADVYATAATIYRALGGRPPVSAEERTQQIAFGNGDPKQPLSSIAPNLPADFATAIDQALAFNMRERTASIQALREALGWTDAKSSSATVAIARDASTTPAFATTPNSAPPPATALTPKRPSVWRWVAPVIVAATLVGAVVLIGGNALNLFGRGPALIVQAPPPVLTRQPAPAEQPPPAPQTQLPQTTAPQTTAPATPPAPAEAPPVIAAKKELPPPDPQAEARRDFELTQKIDTRVAYEEFLRRHPDGYHAQLARAQLRRIGDTETRELTVSLNGELRRLGCGVIGNDSVWGDDSKKALTAFNQHAATKFDIDVPKTDALEALRSKASRVCPVVCGPGQIAQGDYCIAACAPGLVRAPNGACARPQVQQPVVRQPPPAAQKRKLVCRWGDFNKGEQPHRQVCEVK
ncbi:MAG TPA: serine/threonine-protein kinase [Xanthobacteraceae bacterium]|nr:serine/threonine-protein kinase [Xanthobacteraceae bacterium]